MVRTAATLQNSDYAGQYSNQIQNLKNWAMEIIRATLPQMTVRLPGTFLASDI